MPKYKILNKIYETIGSMKIVLPIINERPSSPTSRKLTENEEESQNEED
jgi:hypothetical protein